MTLKDCTKDELIFVIERLKFYELTVGDYYIQRALFDVEERRNARLLEKSKCVRKGRVTPARGAVETPP